MVTKSKPKPEKKQSVGIAIACSVIAVIASWGGTYLAGNQNLNAIEYSQKLQEEKQSYDVGKLMAADIRARLENLETVYTEGKEFIFPESTFGKGTIISLENIMVETSDISLKDIDRFWENDISVLPNNCVYYIMNFYRTLHYITKTREWLTNYKPECILPQVRNMMQGPMAGSEVSILNNIHGLELTQYYLEMHRCTVKSLCLGYEALAVINIHILKNAAEGEMCNEFSQKFRKEMLALDTRCAKIKSQIINYYKRLDGLSKVGTLSKNNKESPPQNGNEKPSVLLPVSE